MPTVYTPVSRYCPGCQAKLPTGRQRWCSESCAASQVRTCVDCGRSGPVDELFYRTTPKKLSWRSQCRSCYASELRTTDAYREAARRHRQTRSVVPDALRLEIYERDGWKCQLCGKKVGRSYGYQHQRSPVLDHVVPRSKGGSDDPSNLQLAHRVCNGLKSDRVWRDGEQLLLLSEVG